MSARPGRRAFLSGLGGLGLVLAAGCAGRDRSRGVAQVTIRASSPHVIALAVEQVFRREGYRGDADPGQMIFTREGGGGADFAYGTLVSGVETEVEVFITRIGEALFDVWCKAYQVRNAGDRILADRQELSRMHSGRYRRLLEEVRTLVEPG